MSSERRRRTAPGTGANTPADGAQSGPGVFRGDDRVSRDLAAIDWAATPLGSLSSWDRSLTAIVGVVVASRFSMWMSWGDELTFFCNDAYRRDTLGSKYPWALGRPAREVWTEIWDDIGPRIEHVLETGEATWDQSLRLFLERSGYVEETYHTFSYSPLTDDAGKVAGMLCVVSEETERVIAERRMATLRAVGAEPVSASDSRAYLRSAARQLAADSRSLPFTVSYLFDDQGNARIAGASGIATGHLAAPVTISAHDDEPAWPIAALLQGQTVTVDALDDRFPNLPTGAWALPPQAAVALPLPAQGRSDRPYGCLIVGVNRHRPLDDGYRSFLRLIAGQLASGVASVRAYEAERHRAEQLAELDRAKTAFFTNVSHELRTPLTLLLGPAEDALTGSAPLSDDERRRMELIARNGQRLLKLVGTLLDFARLESGRADATFEPTDLARYTAELASMFQSAVQAAGLDFIVDCPELGEPVFVDREMWAKIVLNLVSNALKFTFTGSIAVTLHKQDRSVRLTVRDTGIGIDPDDQPRVFERFHRVQGAGGRTHEGSGIGLALVAELVALHGGRAQVQSSIGSGSSFTVELPFGAAHLPSEQVATTGRVISAEEHVAGFLAEAQRWAGDDSSRRKQPAPELDPARPRVMVVDDNADMRDYIVSLLSEAYAIQTAGDGLQALELARAQPPDLILSDVTMPRLDGFGLLAALRREPRTVHVPVVMLSARAGEEGIVDGLDAGADDYLVKPFNARELLARVRANLELDRVRRTGEQLQRSVEMQNQAELLAGVGSWEVDLRTGAVRGSEHLITMIGLDVLALQSLGYEGAIEALIHPDERASMREHIDSALAGHDRFELDARLIAHGDERWIHVRGDVVDDADGELLVVRGFIQDISGRIEAERALAAAAAARQAAAFEHSIADSLQRSLLPEATFESAQLRAAGFYRAGVEGTRAGGDFYDAIDLGGGRTALVIGDVTGRGVRAASMMGQLRAAIRAYARLDLPPSEVLERLGRLVEELCEGRLVTCVYAVFNPANGQLLYASAGHLPPLLAGPDQPARRLPGPTGPPLGTGFTRYGEHAVDFPAGSRLLLYTDGLVERRDGDLDANIDVLARELESGVTLDRLPETLVESLRAQGLRDDIAILVAEARPDPLAAQQSVTLPPEPASVALARRFAARRLDEWKLPPGLAADALVIVSELVTNAIVYGRPPVVMRLRRTHDELVIEVDDCASALPRKLRATREQISGRGLSIVAELADRWAARANGAGKTVWAVMRLPAPSPSEEPAFRANP